MINENKHIWIAVKDGKWIAGDPDLGGLLKKLPDPACTCV